MPSEADYSAKMVKVLMSKHIRCFKTSERWRSGVPDIYVRGGHWVESKIIISPRPTSRGNNKSVHIPKYFTTDQQDFMEKWDASGDKTSAFIVFHDARGCPRQWTILPWHFISRRTHWDREDIQRFAFGTLPDLDSPLLEPYFSGDIYEQLREKFMDRAEAHLDRFRRGDQ